MTIDSGKRSRRNGNHLPAGSSEAAEEKALLRSFDRGEWKSVANQSTEKKRFQGYAAATLRKDCRVNIRISGRDLEAIQKRAVEEGLPYQTLISSLLHKYVAGRLREA
jgi:predicted DNA binding CopG/RHH family protein